MTGQGCQGVADLLVRDLGVDVLVEDRFFRVLARASAKNPNGPPARDSKGHKDEYRKPQYEDPEIAKFVQLAWTTKRPVLMPKLPAYDVEARVIFPIVVGGEKLKGYLHVFETNLIGEKHQIAQAALGALAVEIVIENKQARLVEEIKKGFLLGLFSEEKDQDAHLVEEGRLLGIDLTRPSWLVVVEAEDSNGTDVEVALKSIISDLGINGSVMPLMNCYVLFVEERQGNGEIDWAELNQRLEIISAALEKTLPGAEISIGVGRKCLKIRDYKAALREAQKAITTKKLVSKDQKRIAGYYSLGLLALLTQPGNERLLVDFARQLLGPLYEYDRANNTRLMETVRCYLQHRCCVQSAAAELFIHPNTLRYRLDRAAKTTSLEFLNPDRRLEMELAFKVCDYFGFEVLAAED